MYEAPTCRILKVVYPHTLVTFVELGLSVWINRVWLARDFAFALRIYSWSQSRVLQSFASIYAVRSIHIVYVSISPCHTAERLLEYSGVDFTVVLSQHRPVRAKDVDDFIINASITSHTHCASTGRQVGSRQRTR